MILVQKNRDRAAMIQMILLIILVTGILVGLALGFYWFLAIKNDLLKDSKKKLPQQIPGVYVYPKYRLENLIEQKIFGPNVYIK